MTIASSRGPIVKTNEELINAIKQGKADPTVISNFTERFMGACDGRSTESDSRLYYVTKTANTNLCGGEQRSPVDCRNFIGVSQ